MARDQWLYEALTAGVPLMDAAGEIEASEARVQRAMDRTVSDIADFLLSVDFETTISLAGAEGRLIWYRPKWPN